MPVPENIRAIVTDIEGTTTPISFVYDTLFPFARERLDAACARASTDPRIADALERLLEEHRTASRDASAAAPDFGNGAAYARNLMDRDRKSTGLKALQGVIWEEGYRSGELRAEVFDDVPDALAAWREAGIRLRVFSSGSVLAQKLLFAHTNHGDLSSRFEGFHDTTTGPKQDAGSYFAIAEALGIPAAQVLYLSDVTAELDAARIGGMRTGLLVRPGNRPQPSTEHPAYDDFLGLVG